MRLFSFVLIIGGIIALIYGGFSYSGADNFLGLQFLSANFIVVPPILGGLMLAAGVMLMRSSKTI